MPSQSLDEASALVESLLAEAKAYTDAQIADLLTNAVTDEYVQAQLAPVIARIAALETKLAAFFATWGQP